MISFLVIIGLLDNRFFSFTFSWMSTLVAIEFLLFRLLHVTVTTSLLLLQQLIISNIPYPVAYAPCKHDSRRRIGPTASPNPDAEARNRGVRCAL